MTSNDEKKGRMDVTKFRLKSNLNTAEMMADKLLLSNNGNISKTQQECDELTVIYWETLDFANEGGCPRWLQAHCRMTRPMWERQVRPPANAAKNLVWHVCWGHLILPPVALFLPVGLTDFLKVGDGMVDGIARKCIFNIILHAKMLNK